MPLPHPSYTDHLLGRPGGFSGYPIFVFQVDLSNEDREHHEPLFTDAEDKYFAVTTHVNM